MTDLRLEDVIEHGRDSGRGNLLGIQPFMIPADYAGAETFHAKLDGYLDAAAQRRAAWLNERTIAVFPEYIGTWLVVAGEGVRTRQASTLAGAMRTLTLSHPFPLARTLLSAGERDRVAAGLFRLKAREMARIYGVTFSRLAKQYAVTVVAGSIVLPSPEIRDGLVLSGSGPLRNVTAVYRPDGLAHATLARKAYPLVEELRFLAAATVSELPVFETPAGRLGVLVCADSWYPAPYERLRAQGVEMIAVPSFLTRDGVWDKPWRGYDGATAPGDVNLSRDAGTLTEGQAWRTYGLAGRIAQAGVRRGINVFLRGALWDLGSDGRSLIVSDGATMETQGRGAALLNLWL